MKNVEINQAVMKKSLLPEILVDHTFNQMPYQLKALYEEKKQQGLQVNIGLDINLGFYLVEVKNTTKLEMLWYENFKQKNNYAQAV